VRFCKEPFPQVRTRCAWILGLNKNTYVFRVISLSAHTCLTPSLFHCITSCTNPLFLFHPDNLFIDHWIVTQLVVRRVTTIAVHYHIARRAVPTLTDATDCCLVHAPIRSSSSCRRLRCGIVMRWPVHFPPRFCLCPIHCECCTGIRATAVQVRLIALLLHDPALPLSSTTSPASSSTASSRRASRDAKALPRGGAPSTRALYWWWCGHVLRCHHALQYLLFGSFPSWLTTRGANPFENLFSAGTELRKGRKTATVVIANA
jgi:hypothetical protein